jgi:hypothetical protein
VEKWTTGRSGLSYILSAWHLVVATLVHHNPPVDQQELTLIIIIPYFLDIDHQPIIHDDEV